MNAIEIFRTGRHTATNGATIEFGAADLAAIASGYDAALHEAPIVVGHPQADAPAYGWVKGVSLKGDRLSVDTDQVDPAFAELVTAGRFKKVSASFYTPNDPANPKPGAYYLRHVGFLGAQPPAVKGLKQTSFADSGGALTFADWNGMTVASLFRNIRDHIIGHYGQDEADRVLPSDTIDGLGMSAARDDNGGNPAASDQSPLFSERTDQMPTASELEQRQRELDAREATLAAQSASFAEREARLRAVEFGDFLAPLIAAGKVLPAQKAGLLAFMETLHGHEPVSFGEAGSAKTAPLDFLKAFLSALPKAVDFGERAAGDGADLVRVQPSAVPGYLVDPDKEELRVKAIAYQEAHAGVDFITAYKLVGGK